MDPRPRPKTSLRRWCLICRQDLVTCKSYYSIKQKKNLCKLLTDCVGQNAERSESQYICRVCFRKTQRIEHSSALREELRDQYIATNGTIDKENLQPKLTTPRKSIDDREKRMLSHSPSSPSNSSLQPRRKIARSVQLQLTLKEDPQDVTQIEAIITHNGIKKRRQVPLKWTSVVMAILEDQEAQVFEKLNTLEGFQLHAQNSVLRAIGKECHTLCSTSKTSQFRQTTKGGFESFSFNRQMRELEEQTPVLLSALTKAATGTFIEQNRMGTSASLVPGILTAAAVLFNCTSEHMNAHQLMMGFTLLEGSCNRRTFRRLGMRNLCTSYSYVLQKQLEFGEGFDCRVKDWAEKVKRSSESQDKDVPRVGESKSFQLVMDNVDMVVQARHTRHEHYGTSYHMANIIAIKNRVQAPHNLSNRQPTTSSVETIDLGLFLPSLEDDKLMKNNWVVLMGHIIAENIPSLQWFARELPTVIPHDHMLEARQKSEVVNLGVLMEDENTSEGIYNIMHHMHKYVPGHDSDSPVDIISAGDLLTCERESSCIEEQQNSKTPNKRLEGLIPVIADFHSYANFLQVVWQNLYDTSSGADKVTLYAARNFLEARNVTKDPMKNINAASDLLETYTKSLVIAAAMEYFGMENADDEPAQNNFHVATHHDRSPYVRTALNEIIDKFVIPHMSEVCQDVPQFKCTQCPKVFKTRNGMQKHVRSKHFFSTATPNNQPPQREDTQEDSIFNYARCATSMCLVALNFADARRMGDGERILRMYKYFLLHFKANGKHKYSFQTLRLLAEVNCFLSPQLSYELVWNRFVNKTGKTKGNIEVDRELEHQNRVFKDQCKALRGKVTQQSVQRVSHFAQTLHERLEEIDVEVSIRKQSGRHTKHDDVKDVVALAVEMKRCNLFQQHPGRHMTSLLSFPTSTLGALNSNISDLHRWMRNTLKVLARQHVFRKQNLN